MAESGPSASLLWVFATAVLRSVVIFPTAHRRISIIEWPKADLLLRYFESSLLLFFGLLWLSRMHIVERPTANLLLRYSSVSLMSPRYCCSGSELLFSTPHAYFPKGFRHQSTRVLFLLGVRPRYDLGSCIFQTVFWHQSARVLFL